MEQIQFVKMEQIQVVKMKVVDGKLVEYYDGLRMVEVEPDPTDEEVKWFDVMEQLENACDEVWEYAEDRWGELGKARMEHKFIFFAGEKQQEGEAGDIEIPIDFADWEEVAERRERGWLSDGSAEVEGTFC